MTNRNQSIEELLSDLQAIRRHLGHPAASAQKDSITASQWTVLALLFEREKMTVKELASALSISSSAATQLADALVHAGHISRTESVSDRRVVELTIRKETARKITAKREAYVIRLSKLFDALSDAEFKQYVSLNKKIAEALATRNRTSI